MVDTIIGLFSAPLTSIYALFDSLLRILGSGLLTPIYKFIASMFG